MKTISGLIILITLFIAGCESDLEKIREVTAGYEAMVESGEDVVMYYTTYGKLKSRLITPEIKRFLTEEPYLEFPQGFRIYFYDENKEIDSRLTAHYGIYYENKEELIARDNVVVINIKGEKLNTEELIWSRKTHQITSDKFVKITTPEEIIFGDGLIANEEFTEYTIKNIKGTFQVVEPAGQPSAE